MINFHPTTQQLDAFSLGECEPALALMVAAHIDMCSHCQRIVNGLQEVQAIAQLSDVTTLSPDMHKMMANIMQLPQSKPAVVKPATDITIELDGKRFKLPRALKRYAGKTGSWSRLVGKLWQAPVDLGYPGKAHFIYMEKGGKVPEHTHKGSELTLVIDGQYSDGIADYDCGDLTLLDGQHNHQPFSEADDGCLVFTIVDKPLYFTSGIARLLNPFSNLFF